MWFIPDAIEEVKSRPSAVLKPDGSPYELVIKREPIGFVLKGKDNASTKHN